MRSLLVVTLFTVAEARLPDDTVVGDHHSKGMEHIQKYGDYSKYMNTYSGGWSSSYVDYQKYMDEYSGNNSNSEDYKDKYEKKYGDWETYKKKYGDWHKYEKEGEKYKKKYQEKYADKWTTTVNAVPATVDAVHTTPAPTEEATAEPNTTHGASLVAPTMLAEFGASSATEPHSKGMEEHIQKYGDYSKYMSKYGGDGSSNSYGDYQKYMDEYNGNNSNSEDYKDKYEKKYGDWEAYKKKYGDWHKYENEGNRYEKKYQEKYADKSNTTVNAVPTTIEAVQRTPAIPKEATASAVRSTGLFEDASVQAVQPTPAPSQQATALLSLAERGRSPWLLVLCAFAGSSIPLAFVAARRWQQSESCEEESARFLLMV